MKVTALLQGVGLAAAIVFTRVAAANVLILSPASGTPTLLGSGDVGEIPIAGVSPLGSPSLPQDWFFDFTGSGPLGATVSSIDLPLAPGFNFSISGITATLFDLNTSTGYGGTGSTVQIPDATPGQYELIVGGTVDGTLGGLYSGAVASVASVPIPAAAWLFLSGVAGVAALSRRRPKPDAAVEATEWLPSRDVQPRRSLLRRLRTH